MGYFGKVELQRKAVELRKQGKSLRSIQEILHVSRSSVSLWVRSVTLTTHQRNALYASKKAGGLKGSYIASQNKILRKRQLIERIQKSAVQELGNLSKRDRFIAGIALYFGEGNKMDKSVVITNANPAAIKFMTRWFEEFCNIPPSRLKLSLYLHDDQDERRAKQYWSKLLTVDSSQFNKSYLVKPRSGSLRKTKYTHGILRVTIGDVNLHRKIMGWISGVFKL